MAGAAGSRPTTTRISFGSVFDFPGPARRMAVTRSGLSGSGVAKSAWHQRLGEMLELKNRLEVMDGFMPGFSPQHLGKTASALEGRPA
jgi:hypothetical protein